MTTTTETAPLEAPPERGARKSPIAQDPEACLAARKAAKLTQDAAAKQHLGISGGYLSEIEKGTRSAPLPLQERMAALYGVDAATLAAKPPKRRRKPTAK